MAAARFMMGIQSGSVVWVTRMAPSTKRPMSRGLSMTQTGPAATASPMALELLQAGVDRAVIALWLGHKSVETTQIYLEATLAMKEQALGKTSPPNGTPGRYRPGDELLNFLDGL